jgi:hypothetical protein
MNRELPSTHQLARTFARHVVAAVSRHHLTHIRAANKGRYTLEGQDALHEHLDPHVLMHDAWTHLTSIPMRIDNHEHTRLTEAAMTLSKSHDHDPHLIPLAP